MKKAAKILYLVAFIITIVSIVTLAVDGVVNIIYAIVTFLGLKTNFNWEIHILVRVLLEFWPEAVDYVYYYLGAIFLTIGLAALFTMVIYIVALVFIKKGRKEDASFGMHITVAVFGLVLENYVTLAAGVVAAIAKKKEERRAAKADKEKQVIDVESKPVE